MGKNKWWQTIIFLAVFGVISGVYFHKLTSQPMHVDEHEWIRRGAIFYEAYFVDHNFSRDLWESETALDQPKLGEYAFGGWLRLIYREDLNNLFERVHFNGDWKLGDDTNKLWTKDKWWISGNNRGYKEAFEVLVSCRYLTVLFGLVTLGSIYWLTLKIWGYWEGLFAVIFLAINPIFYKVSRLALLDSLLVCLMIISLLLVYVYSKKILSNKLDRLWFWELLVALSLGLVASVKLNGLMVFGCFGISMVTVCVMKRKKIQLADVLMSMARVGLMGLLVFVLVNPMLWGSPMETVKLMYRQRVETTERHLVNFPWSALPTLQTRAKRMLFVGLGIGKVNQLVGWMFLAGVGLVSILWRKITWEKVLVLAWFAVKIGFMLWYLQLGWYWHYMIILPWFALLEALGLVSVYNHLKKQFLNKKALND